MGSVVTYPAALWKGGEGLPSRYTTIAYVAGWNPAIGTTVGWAGGHRIRYMGSSYTDGLPDAPSWVPDGENDLACWGFDEAASGAENKAAYDAAYAYAVANVDARTLVFPSGSYEITGELTVSDSWICWRGDQTILRQTSATAGLLKCRPAGTITGNTQIGNHFDGFHFTRDDDTATAGVAAWFGFCAQFSFKNCRFSRFHRGIDIEASQDWTLDNIQGFGMFSGGVRTGSFIFRNRSGQKTDGSWLNAWQGRVTNFNFAGGWNTENVIVVNAADGLEFTAGYANGGVNSNFKAEIADGGYIYTTTANVYLDGGNPAYGTDYSADIITTGTVRVTFGSGSFLGNSETAALKITGSGYGYVNVEGSTLHGWSATPPRLVDMDAPNATLNISGGQLIYAGNGVRITRAKSVRLIGSHYFLGVTPAGYAVEFVTSCDRAVVIGNTMDLFNGVSDLSGGSVPTNKSFVHNIGSTNLNTQVFQESATDLTAGRALIVGAFGAAGSFEAPGIDDLEVTLRSGVYAVAAADAATSGGPDSGYDAIVEVRRGIGGETFFTYTRSGTTSRARWTGYRSGSTGAITWLIEYLSGTFTPSITFGGAAVGMTYAANRSGRYSIVGKRLSFDLDMSLTARGSSTGAVSVLTGLGAAYNAAITAAIAVRVNNYASGAAYAFCADVLQGDTYCRLFYPGTSGTQITALQSDLSDTVNIRMSGSWTTV